ncbi:MAG: ribonuclease HI [Phycisphaerales bacterium]|jgi:ribonuclease HI|nr:ribonuclease HI [Phycisphaerales bacterium]
MEFEQSEASQAVDREALLSALPEIPEEEIRHGELQIPVGNGLPDIELFTDGGCSPNPGPGGWAFILRPAGGHSKSGIEHAGAVRHSTNNRMELTAVIRGLLSLEQPCRVRIVSDSEYVIKGLSEWIDGWKRRGWVNSRKKPVLNEELWRVLDVLRHHHNLDPQWTRGHAGHAENERCDVLVGMVRDRLG